MKCTKTCTVDETSVAPVLIGTEKAGIASDHREKYRFDRKDSPRFRTMIDAKNRYCDEVPGEMKGPTWKPNGGRILNKQ